MIKIAEIKNIDKHVEFATYNGVIKSTSPLNVLKALRADEFLSKHLKCNEFTYSYVITEDIKLGRTLIKKGEMPSNFESILKVFFENNLGVTFSNQALTDGLETFFSENKFNPVKEYMEDAERNWDGRTRIYTLFQEYLGADDSLLISKIGVMWLVGAVAKVYEPNVKFDYVLDLIGSQGVGKTTFLQKLGNQWYTDAVTDFMNKDNYEIMLGALIVNDDEMVASNRMGFEETKSFISKTSLKFRKSYARRSEEYDKNFVIARTTNQQEYLKDKTGERRFLPVEANKERQRKHPANFTVEEIKNIWGEAVALYKEGFSLSFDKETENDLNEYRRKFMYRDEIEQMVLEYLEMPVTRDFSNMSAYQQQNYTEKYFNNDKNFTPGIIKQDKVATREVMYNLFKKNATDRILSKKINMILSHLPDWEKSVYRVNGKNTKGFKRVLLEND